MASITIQVPESLVGVLEPLDGALQLAGSDVDGLCRDLLIAISGDLELLAESQDPQDPAALRVYASQLEMVAAAVERIETAGVA